MLVLVICNTYSSLYILPDTYSDPVIHWSPITSKDPDMMADPVYGKGGCALLSE